MACKVAMMISSDYCTTFAADRLAGGRGERWLFEDVSFALTPGDALIVVGPNGSGKTTLLRILSGLLPPLAGDIIWTNQPSADQAKLHYLGHHNSVKGALTGAENLHFWQQISGMADEGRIAAATRTLMLDELIGLPARVLSAGQRRRLALARLLAVPAPVWILDEPTSALDTGSASAVSRMVDAHRKLGGIVVLATHHVLGVAQAKILDFGQLA